VISRSFMGHRMPDPRGVAAVTEFADHGSAMNQMNAAM
jgi:hypothetical protein